MAAVCHGGRDTEMIWVVGENGNEMGEIMNLLSPFIVLQVSDLLYLILYT